MVAVKMVLTKWYEQNKLVYGQNGIGQYGMDKMVWTKWYGQNGSQFCIDFNSIEFSLY